jgi:hypothetical protein
MIAEVRQLLTSLSDDIDKLRQTRLLSAKDFVTFAESRGMPAFNVLSEGPLDFRKRGWLAPDGSDFEGRPLFHPFRLYPVHMVLRSCPRVRISPTDWLRSERVAEITEVIQKSLPSFEELDKLATQSNEVAELAVLLEPIYWPRITSQVSRRPELAEAEHEALRRAYQAKVLEILRDMDAQQWRSCHEDLRLVADDLDRNGPLYVLLRLSRWDQRARLTGTTSGALWLRHIAEVVRRGFEEARGEKWLEEDWGYGTWNPMGRRLTLGSERPLDDESQARFYVALNFGLSGARVRWYVEGKTEYYAVLEVLKDPSTLGIELVDLRGNFETGKGNIALKFSDALTEDRKLKRFSFISFDLDVEANVKTVRRQVEQGNVVGYIAAHAPDFEFANFTLDELVEIAARLDEDAGSSGEPIRRADWSGVGTARAFAERYSEVSARGPATLKHEKWGRALAAYATANPVRPGGTEERPFVLQMRAALTSRLVHYDLHNETYTFDPNTFVPIPRPADVPQADSEGS